MKTTEKVLGYLAAFTLLVAMFFKLMHFPGASMLMLAGAVFFIFGFSVFWIFRVFKDADSTLKKVTVFLIFLFMIGIVSSYLFKVQHWPFGQLLLEASFVLYLILIPFLIFRAINKEDEFAISKAHSSAILFIIGGLVAFTPALFNKNKTPMDISIQNVAFENPSVNVVFVGVENAIKVAVPDIPNDFIRLVSDNGTIKGEKCNYTLKPEKEGVANIDVFYKDYKIGTYQYKVILNIENKTENVLDTISQVK